jgi:hypothetical protein
MSETRFQRFSEYQKALILWLQGGKKGTQPRKVRANSAEKKLNSRKLRVQRDRVRRRLHKSTQKVRIARNQNVRTGRR